MASSTAVQDGPTVMVLDFILHGPEIFLGLTLAYLVYGISHTILYALHGRKKHWCVRLNKISEVVLLMAVYSIASLYAMEYTYLMLTLSENAA